MGMGVPILILIWGWGPQYYIINYWGPGVPKNGGPHINMTPATEEAGRALGNALRVLEQLGVPVAS